MHVSVNCQCALRQNAGFRFGLVPDVETPMRHFTLPQYIHSLQSLVIRVYVLFLSFGKYFINATCWLMYRDNRLTTPPQACETGSGWAAAVTHCQHSSGCGSRLWRHDNKPDLTLRISRLEKKKWRRFVKTITVSQKINFAKSQRGLFTIYLLQNWLCHIIFHSFKCIYLPNQK